jgi:hypothetical protein
VTAKYWVPAEHEEAVRMSAIVIATIDPRVPEGYTEDSWRRDVAHRWIHSIQLQPTGSLRGYSIWKPGKWTPRLRR